MPKRKKKSEDYIEMDVNPLLLDDEFDIKTEEDLPDDNPELTESMIGGEADAKKQVQSLYRSLKFVYGKYDPNYISPFHSFIFHFAPIWVMIGAYIMCILVAINYGFTLDFWFIFICGTVLPIVFLWLQRKEIKSVWWWKEKGRTVSIYQIDKKNGKGDIIVYVNSKYMWRYDQKKGQWVENDLIVMGSRLLFNKMTGELRTKEMKDGKVEIGAYRRGLMQASWCKRKTKDTKILLKDGVPVYIDHWTERGSDGESVNTQRFFFHEINTDKKVGIPRSFLDFCEEKGIEPLKEGEHLYYL